MNPLFWKARCLLARVKNSGTFKIVLAIKKLLPGLTLNGTVLPQNGPFEVLAHLATQSHRLSNRSIDVLLNAEPLASAQRAESLSTKEITFAFLGCWSFANRRYRRKERLRPSLPSPMCISFVP